MNGDRDSLRVRFTDFVRTYEGAKNPDPRYLALIAPNETPKRRAEMGAMSSCFLALMGFWGAFGLEHELLAANYVDGKAPQWALKVARDKNALREGHFDASHFALGNAIVLDGDKADVHTYTVVDPQPISGGRVAVLSILCVPNSSTWDERETPPVLARRVTHVIDVEALFAA
jgi:hypothetical protein